MEPRRINRDGLKQDERKRKKGRKEMEILSCLVLYLTSSHAMLIQMRRCSQVHTTPGVISTVILNRELYLFLQKRYSTEYINHPDSAFSGTLIGNCLVFP